MHIKKNIKKILIANRSEIALRIQATCLFLGIKTVVIFAAEDSLCRFVEQADESYLLSGYGVQAYLNKEEIIKIALQAGADAVHPGYGFLAEQADFAELVIHSGLIWIGPKPSTMRIAGDKAHARSFVKRQGFQVLDGINIEHRDDEAKKKAREEASLLGYPIIIKDAQAGGGKAMRKITSDSDFELGWDAVIAEGKRLGCSGGIVIEKFIEYARHLEVQVAGDGQHAVHYYERECSIQRKHQKIIEEAPCRFLQKNTILTLHTTAVLITEALRYKGIGTVEFLVDAQEQIYFLEINPRLQVEHSVTEYITNTDLVALQVWLAEENPLPLTQDSIITNGHAIEVRIYAEDPQKNFLPSSGFITNLEFPYGRFLRIDHDLQEGGLVSPSFDPMIAKFTAYGNNRQTAINLITHALNNFLIDGIITNSDFLISILNSKEFFEGTIFTQLLANTEYLNKITTTNDNIETLTTKQIAALTAICFIEQEPTIITNKTALTKASHLKIANQHPVVHKKCCFFWKKQLWI